MKERKETFSCRSVVNDEVSSSFDSIAEQEHTQPKPKKKEFKDTQRMTLNKVLNRKSRWYSR